MNSHQSYNGASHRGGGEKRDSRGLQNSQMNGQQPLLRPPQAAVTSAPSVPSFGFQPLLPSKPATSTPINEQDTEAPRNKKRRLANTLGITPKDAEDMVDSDVEEDEEAAFRNAGSDALPGMQGIFFKSRTELLAWVAERKKRWPTAAKRETAELKAREAKEEAQRKRAQKEEAARKAQLENLRRMAQASREHKGKDKKVIQKSRHTEDDRTQEKLEKALRKAEKLQKQLSKANEGNSSAVANVTPKPKSSLLGDNYASDSGSAADSGNESGEPSSSDTSSGSDSDSDSSSDDSSDDSDEAPEETSSRLTKPALKPLPPDSSNTQRTPAGPKPVPDELLPFVKQGYCKYFLQKGFCRKGKECKFKHSRPPSLPKPTLYEKVCYVPILQRHMC